VSFASSIYFHFFFFFSSRRRHTRFSRDWSSDVCSSDLCFASAELSETSNGSSLSNFGSRRRSRICSTRTRPSGSCSIRPLNGYRSEERRVGKESSGQCSKQDKMERRHETVRG